MLAEINGCARRRLSCSRATTSSATTARRRAAHGSTAGIYADGVNQAARRRSRHEQNWIASEWGWAWPKNTRILYNRASADADGKPWSERKRYVWWDAEKGKWTGLGDTPDFPGQGARTTSPTEDAKAMDAIRGDDPVHRAPRRARLAVRADRAGRRPAADPLRAARVAPSPTRSTPSSRTRRASCSRARRTPTTRAAARAGAHVFPFVMTTYRLTEHHTAGGMSRTVPYLSELQPEMFCEVSPAARARSGASSTAAGRRS